MIDRPRPLSLGLSMRGASSWNSALGGGGGAPVNPVQTNIEAWFKYGVGITSSQWDDASGNARHMTLFNSPTIQSGGAVLLNGTTQYGKTDAFALSQPVSLYMLMKQVTWTSDEYFTDGGVQYSMLVAQKSGGASPEIVLYAGAVSASDSNLAVGSYGVVKAVFNGASSFLGVNNNAGATVNAGITVISGFTFGAKNDGLTNHSNIEVKEIILYSGAHDASTRAQVVAYLAAVGGIAIDLFLMLMGGEALQLMDGSNLLLTVS